MEGGREGGRKGRRVGARERTGNQLVVYIHVLNDSIYLCTYTFI